MTAKMMDVSRRTYQWQLHALNVIARLIRTVTMASTMHAHIETFRKSSSYMSFPEFFVRKNSRCILCIMIVVGAFFINPVFAQQG